VAGSRPAYPLAPLVEGVSCDSCHGSPEKWLASHADPSFRRLTPGAKEELGMRDLKSVVTRAKLCSHCHVGGRDKEVNHALSRQGTRP
jgi:hypothetical protein